MRAEQVIDMQVDLLRRFDDPTFTDVFKGTIAPAQSTARYLTPMQAESNIEQILQATRGQVKAAYAFRVAKDMCMVVQHAASLLDESDMVATDLPPTGCGIVRFEQPLPLEDARGKSMKIHWMTWGPLSGNNGIRVVPGILLTFWNDLDDPDEIAQSWMKDIPNASIRRTLGRWSVMGADLLYEGQQLGPGVIDLKPEDAARILADGDQVSPFTNTARYAVALWMLLDQTVTDVREEHVRKTSARVARRMNIPGRVSVIQLRRHEGARGQGETDVEWSHRWVVRGHWRWQAYGPRHSERRRIWVAPFVKGPSDKPLVVPEKVYDLRR